jgi:hypothetical protein
MGKLSPATVESIETAQGILDELIPSQKSEIRVRNEYKLWESLSRVINCKAYAVAARRRYVATFFDGTNYAEIAKRLGVKLYTVKNDVAWYYKTKRSDGSVSKTRGLLRQGTALHGPALTPEGSVRALKDSGPH